VIRRTLSAQGVDVARFERERRGSRIFAVDSSDSSKMDVLTTLKTIRAESTEGMAPRSGSWEGR
jgi:hypothetical protein